MTRSECPNANALPPHDGGGNSRGGGNKGSTVGRPIATVRERERQSKRGEDMLDVVSIFFLFVEFRNSKEFLGDPSKRGIRGCAFHPSCPAGLAAAAVSRDLPNAFPALSPPPQPHIVRH